MAARKIAAKEAGGAGGMTAEQKCMTMMRPNELLSMDEDMRIALFEMVKDGSLTVEEAHAEVKRTQPKEFKTKYVGAISGLAPTLKSTLSDEQGSAVVAEATKRLKKSKLTPLKIKLHVSTIGLKIAEEAVGEDGVDMILENDPIGQIAYCAVHPSDKKRVVYVTSYSRLGIVWTHMFQCAKTKDAAEIVETILDRRTKAAQAGSKLKSSRLESMSAYVGDDEEDEPGGLGFFFTRYLGHVEVDAIQGDEVVRDAIHRLKDVIKVASSSRQSSGSRRQSTSTRKSSSSTEPPASPAGGDGAENSVVTVNMPALLVVSSEGIRIIDEVSRDVHSNVIIKAVSYSTEVIGKKIELFAFIEVDDRRNTKTCHVFMCEKGVKDAALAICNAVCAAFEAAVAEAKARAGNPLLPMDKVRDMIEGPLAALQVPRKDLVAIKAIGAGQFGKVYLASGAPGFERCAIKMLRLGAAVSDRTEFVREAETMVTIGEHDNIVRMIGVALQQRPWLVVLEYCLYGDLSDVVKALGRRKITLTAGEQLHIGEQLAKGLAFVASKRFVHMDFAARNVLVTEGSTMKIADFGLTHSYDEGKDYYKQLGVLKLSIRWLAIDSFDTKIFSEKADVWSWGITMWELFSYGVQPYRGYGLQEVLKMVRAGYRLEKPEDCSENVFKMLEMCWLPDRNERPTFLQLAETIQGLSAALPGGPGEIRDVGQLLNADLKPKIERASIRVKKSIRGKPAAAAAAPAAPEAASGADPEGPASAVDEEGLTGMADLKPGTTATLSKLRLDSDEGFAGLQ